MKVLSLKRGSASIADTVASVCIVFLFIAALMVLVYMGFKNL